MFNFGDVDGLSVTDVDLSGAHSNWGPLFNLDGITGDIDATGFDLILPTNSDNPLKPYVTELQGEKPGQVAENGNAPFDQTIEGTQYRDVVNGSSGDDVLNGNDGDDLLVGGAGEDTLTGGGGTDIIDGGDGVDVAVFAATASPPVWKADHWEVTDGADTDKLTGVEKVVIDGDAYLLVDPSGANGFISIQAAIDAASDGDTIFVLPGTYTESRKLQSDDGRERSCVQQSGGLADQQVGDDHRH